MTDKQQLTVGDLALAIAGLGEGAKLCANGVRIHGVHQQRNAGGDLELNFLTETPATAVLESPVVPVPEASLAPDGLRRDTDDSQLDDVDEADRKAELTERRLNDPDSLTEDERAELAQLEKLAGVEERRENTPDPAGSNTLPPTTEPL